MNDNTKRFSSRVDNYAKYRPSYPEAMVDYLAETHGLSDESIVADIGSGTGILSRLLLPRAKQVFAVEPNDDMRGEAERMSNTDQRFVSVAGTAENSKLDTSSVDFITVAQAFHWFDLDKTKPEFNRILKRNGSVFVIWNKRLVDTEFLVEYEHCLTQNLPEYNEVNHTNITAKTIESFVDRGYAIKTFENSQHFDWQGVLGRLNSSSYAPAPDTDIYKKIEKRLRTAFDRFSTDGVIEFRYETEVHSGKFGYINAKT